MGTVYPLPTAHGGQNQAGSQHGRDEYPGRRNLAGIHLSHAGRVALPAASET
jgi:hypothetical protein